MRSVCKLAIVSTSVVWVYFLQPVAMPDRRIVFRQVNQPDNRQGLQASACAAAIDLGKIAGLCGGWWIRMACEQKRGDQHIRKRHFGIGLAFSVPASRGEFGARDASPSHLKMPKGLQRRFAPFSRPSRRVKAAKISHKLDASSVQLDRME